ncbi:hypothetical protein FOA52_012343 [Chlamydomonas sp. UWO 241]|nr:hypothetical protein FOA52_012343 [Chlamydomonas sp. UWO 241]
MPHGFHPFYAMPPLISAARSAHVRPGMRGLGSAGVLRGNALGGKQTKLCLAARAAPPAAPAGVQTRQQGIASTTESRRMALEQQQQMSEKLMRIGALLA